MFNFSVNHHAATERWISVWRQNFLPTSPPYRRLNGVSAIHRLRVCNFLKRIVRWRHVTSPLALGVFVCHNVVRAATWHDSPLCRRRKNDSSCNQLFARKASRFVNARPMHFAMSDGRSANRGWCCQWRKRMPKPQLPWRRWHTDTLVANQLCELTGYLTDNVLDLLFSKRILHSGALLQTPQ